MKVILLSSIPKVGNVNDIVDVSEGYAMNNLIPKGLARSASDKNVSAIEKQIKENKAKDEVRKNETAQTIRSLDKESFTVKASASEKGTLFSSISATDLSTQIKEDKGIDIDSSYIELDQPIKETGEHKVEIAIEDTKATIVVNIEPSE
ncbi:MAG: 50S ribosomal protein L9 [Candidatus Campbellbacteria bacterium]|nr:50S ribosomal protein L9 [Candidatus Campbellbacteria bacterium]